MSNQQVIKSAHIWALLLLLAFGVFAVAGRAGIKLNGQNSNQNANSSGNMNSSQNRNSNRSNRNSKNSNATGEQAGTGTLNTHDRDFMMDAAIGGLMEVELGRVAAQKGMNDSVKQFGQRMVDDHSKANTELMTLASSKGITLPTALDDKHRKDVTKLSGMSGAEFDRAYMKMMVSDHKKDVSEFEKQSTRATDPDVKAFATSTLPTLKDHLQQATTIENSVGGGSNSNSNRTGSNSNRSGNRNSNGNSNRNSNDNRP